MGSPNFDGWCSKELKKYIAYITNRTTQYFDPHTRSNAYKKSWATKQLHENKLKKEFDKKS